MSEAILNSVGRDGLPATRSGGYNLIRFLLCLIRCLWIELDEIKKTVKRLEKELEESKLKLRKTQKVFAPKNEKSPREENEGTEKRKRGAQKGQKPRKRTIPQLEEQKEIELDFSEVPECEVCGKPYFRVPGLDKISHQIELVLKAVQHKITRLTYKKSCGCSKGKSIRTAPQRKSVIPKSVLTTGAWVHLIFMKFFLAVPIYRYLQSMASSGLKVSPGTIENGFKKIGALLEPVYREMILELRKAPLWNADETRWKVFELIDGKKSFLWWLWVFASSRVVLFVIDPSRSAAVIDRIHDSTIRVLSADRYCAYEAMVKKGILIAYCWAHLRRDILALEGCHRIAKWVWDWLDAIQTLYRLNRKRLETSSETEREELSARMREIVEKLRSQDPDSFELSYQRKIVEGFRKRYEGYTYFIDHPEVPMDNNRSERQLKGGINGRKNYLGNVAAASVPHTQYFLSVISTAKNNGVDPKTWLEGYLQACAENNAQPLEGEELKRHVDLLLARTD